MQCIDIRDGREVDTRHHVVGPTKREPGSPSEAEGVDRIYQNRFRSMWDVTKTPEETAARVNDECIQQVGEQQPMQRQSRSYEAHRFGIFDFGDVAA